MSIPSPEFIGIEWEDITAFLSAGVTKTRMGRSAKIDVERALEILRDDDKLRKVVEVIKKHRYRDNKAADTYLAEMFRVHEAKFKDYKAVADVLDSHD
ncbi:MAG: hypothetical protein AB7U75_14540 [Hyphomicrobiaceae bacterium]